MHFILKPILIYDLSSTERLLSFRPGPSGSGLTLSLDLLLLHVGILALFMEVLPFLWIL